MYNSTSRMMEVEMSWTWKVHILVQVFLSACIMLTKHILNDTLFYVVG